MRKDQKANQMKKEDMETILYAKDPGQHVYKRESNCTQSIKYKSNCTRNMVKTGICSEFKNEGTNINNINN